MSKEQFTHLHIHSDASQLDGCAKVSDYVQTASERGNPAIALSDHGTLRGIYELTEACDKYNIKPIYGIEFYVCKDMNRRGFSDEEKEEITKGLKNKTQQKKAIKEAEEKQGIRKNYHLTAWASDNEGLKNLYRLSSMAWIDGFYYRPRIDIDTLCKYNKGIIVGTGCAGSILHGNRADKRPKEADLTLAKLIDTFDDRLYLEIMPHALRDKFQEKANRFTYWIYKLLESKGKLLATQDAHYVSEKDARHHDVLLAIGTHSTMFDDSRFRFDGESYWLKSRREMFEAFQKNHPYFSKKEIVSALNNTVELAERCSAKIEIDPLKCILPDVGVPSEFENDFEYLKHLVMVGVELRDIGGKAKLLAKREALDENEALRIYTKRIAYELKTLRVTGFAGYFLILHDLYQWAEKQDIMYGPGRGSAAGSIVSYLLGITSVDPIEHRLMFERFIAPGRINMPDIDCDFQDSRRDEIIRYLKQRYGEGRVAQISTSGRLSAKQVIKDVARVFDVPFSMANNVTSLIELVEDGDPIDNAIKRHDAFREFSRDYPAVIEHAKALEGLNKTVGIHAAGVVTAPSDLTGLVPLEVRKQTGKSDAVVTAFDMRGCEGIGLLKIDVLGLKTLSVIKDAIELIKRVKKDFDILQVPLDDKKTINGFSNRDFVGVFQYDSDSARTLCSGLKFKEFDDIAVVTAINRPGAIDFAGEYKRRRRSKKLVEKDAFHPKVSEITKDALGLMVYQEHVIRVATDVAGYSASAADKLRKMIGKKAGHEALEAERETFVGGCLKTTKDMTRETADSLWSAIVKFGMYGFNRSHAVSYAMIGYWTMYLKQHYPLEFYCALMQNEKDRKKLQRYVRSAEYHGIKTLMPDINISGLNFEVDQNENAIRGSLVDILGLGEKTVKVIIAEREENGPFKGLIDFLKRRKKSVNKKVIEALATSGAFDQYIENPRMFITEFPLYWALVEKGNWESLESKLEFLSSSFHEQWTEEERRKIAATVNPLATKPHPSIVWEDFLTNEVKPALTDINSQLYAKRANVYCAALAVDCEDRIVGDYVRDKDKPDENRQKVLGYGEKWVRLKVEGLEGSTVAKIDWRQYDLFKEVINKDSSSLLLCAEANNRFNYLDLHFLADIEEINRKLDSNEDLSIWERLFVDHPSLTRQWESKEQKNIALKNPEETLKNSKGIFKAIGVVCHVIETFDKNGKLMAWFSIAGVTGVLRAVCFSSTWHLIKNKMQVGSLISINLKKGREISAIVPYEPALKVIEV